MHDSNHRYSVNEIDLKKHFQLHVRFVSHQFRIHYAQTRFHTVHKTKIQSQK